MMKVLSKINKLKRCLLFLSKGDIAKYQILCRLCLLHVCKSKKLLDAKMNVLSVEKNALFITSHHKVINENYKEVH